MIKSTRSSTMRSNNIKRVAIICGYSFPEGLASTTRILTYAKGLVENGVEVDIYVFFPSDREPNHFSVDGVIDGINYHYPNTRLYPSHVFFRKISHIYFLIISAYKYLKKHKKNHFDVTILSSDFFRILYFYVPILKTINTKAIFIADEYPVPMRVHLKEELPKLHKFLLRTILQQVDGMIFITGKLESFYRSIVLKPSFILPSLTDFSRFSTVVKNDVLDYICYMGSLELSKDNVDNIIEAFNLVKNKYPDLELHLYGTPNRNDLQILERIIDESDLRERVFLKGIISNNKVSPILSASKLLVSSQPDTKRAQGGFPTKLGEYMATGVPMLVTNVGEISKYVKHGVNGWLAEPSNVIDYASKMEYILDNYSEALDVAENGKKYVYKNFDAKLITKEMIHFLNKI
ncbi:glycosyltransferase family 4 protein [Chryseobacterium sp. MDT2-18]|uniref:glycosyltransferase family 4 protein n=1 Tax=Chryseobacterium sp. MDT2-18 TaxID=1259136 RepID=UPI00278653CF|nr:glycosyltransferase family 4 protein [Chryseobacterium sp. MDT2-18]MDQ0476441.1 glycosyltransferase involved in cell wall biosynthesis [Chryseobacterium sp. MDT2-18]